MKLTKDSITKMSAEDIKKCALDIVEAQDALEKAVSDFEARVKKAVSDNTAAVEAIQKSKASIAALAKEAIVQIGQAAGDTGSGDANAIVGVAPVKLIQLCQKCQISKVSNDACNCPECGQPMEKAETPGANDPLSAGKAPVPPVKRGPAADPATDNAVAELTKKVTQFEKAVQERDDVIGELVSTLDALQKSNVTKSDVQAMLKDTVSEFKKGIR